MIIKCEKCQTRFRLDDSKVTDKGVKVRCTKCKYVFTVQKDASGEVAAAAPQSVMDDFSAETTGAMDNSLRESAYDDTPFSVSEPPATEGGNVFSLPDEDPDPTAFSFAEDDTAATLADTAPQQQTPVEDAGFSSFDFGNVVADSGPTTPTTLSIDDFADAAEVPQPAPAKKEVSGGLDFSDDDMFGLVVPAAEEEVDTSISFDFGEDSFAESMDMGGQDTAGKRGALFSLEQPADAPFSLGEIDFGDELTSVAVQQVNPDDLKPSQEILFAPLAEAGEKRLTAEAPLAFTPDEPSQGSGDELPPLSISSRRKQSPLFSGLIAGAALLVVVVLGYFGYTTFVPAKDAATAVDTGKISVRGVKAAFMDNDQAGELLVITGEALNEYQKPRAALQVKATVYDNSGQIIASKSAYGGNPLTEEQLESLPLDKLEASMGNQFGDSLANMEVAPGKAIPFVVVVAKLPKGAKDFSVIAAGSTVATGKQQ